MTRGLTLVELVLTIAVAGIIGVPTGLILGEQLFSAMSSRDSTLATQLARYEMELLDSQNNFFTLQSATFANYQGSVYTLTRTVTCLTTPPTCTSGAPGNQGMKQIQVTVTKTGSTSPLAQLISYRTKCVCFGSNPPLSQTNCANVCS